MEAGQIVHNSRLNELEGWRRKDEPRTLSLVQAATVADEVRKALAERSRHEWSRWQKAAAVVIGLPTFSGAAITLYVQLHALLA